VEFEWDATKSEATERRRGIRFERAAEVLSGPHIMWTDDRRDYGEHRIRAVGESAGEVLHVVFTRRGAAVRVISVRKANRKERAQWHLRA